MTNLPEKNSNKFKLYFKFILLFFLVVFIVPKIVVADSAEEEALLIKYKFQKEINTISHRYGIASNNIDKIEEIGVFKIKNTSFWQKLKLYIDKSLTQQIESIEFDCQYQTSGEPNDVSYSNQWALEKISASDAWNRTTGTSADKIAIIDTGINGLHEDLTGKVLDGYNAITEKTIPANSNSDDNGHGTAVAGVSAAITNNIKGIAGMDWQANIVPIKALDKNGSGYSYNIAKGIIYAADHGAKIINLSLGGNNLSDTLKNAIDYAHDQKGVMVVAASGNENSTINYPAKYGKVFAVGATSRSDNRWSQSNYGSELDIVAPGEQILTTSGNGSYVYATGTSLATPYVSALAAIVWSENPNFSNDQIESIIKNSADKVNGMEGDDFSNQYGYGRINAKKAVESGKKYQAVQISKNGNPNLTQGQSYNFIAKFKNTGQDVWRKDTVYLGTDDPRNRTPRFDQSNSQNSDEISHWINSNRIEMQEDSVAPGEIATFSFWMSVPSNFELGTYSEAFRIVDVESAWIDDSLTIWDINVIRPTYQAQFISQSGYPTIMPGDTSEMQVQFKNVGTATWFSNSSNPVLLATDKLKDENFLKQFNDNWINDYRITSMSPSVVNPGETATFNFSVKAPNIGYGDYHFYVRLVSEGLTWFDNPDTNGGAWWNINIPKPSAEWQGQSGSVTASPGQEVSASVTFKNTTGSTWKKNGTGAIHLATDKLRDESFLDSFKASSWLGDYRISTFSEDEVENGQNATFNFNLKIPANIAPGTYRFYVRLVSEGYSWFENPDTNGGAWWEVNVS
jgi:hypothetical protein